MKIKRVECDQFAGVHDIDIEFVDGLNLVIGENESGKSTIADLIFRILFKDTKIDGRSDATFIDWYFPKKLRGPQGDVIDGTLEFATDKGNYKLSREWQKRNGSSRLKTPEKTWIKNTDEITRILAEELGYREGVFDEIVFASQKRKQSAIESIMKALPRKKDELSKTRDNLTSTVTQAALETGGVSLEKLERRLQKNLEDLGGHWDSDADAPEVGKDGKKHGIKNEWKQNVGTVLEAYYKMEETRQNQRNAEKAEREVEKCQKELKKWQNTKKAFEEQRTEFWKYKGLIEKKDSLDTTIRRDREDIGKMRTVYKNWPKYKQNLEEAKELRKQQELLRVKIRYKSVKTALDDYEEKKRRKSGLTEITTKDVNDLENIINQKHFAERKISGLNLTARIKQLGELPVEVKNTVTGEQVYAPDGEYSIAEAVEITIPDVMEMQLIPKGVDVDWIREQINSANEEIQKGFERHGVTNIDELREKLGEYEKACREYDDSKRWLDTTLNGESWEDIKEAYEKIDVELLSEEDLKKSIETLCGRKSIDAYIGGVENNLYLYQNEYNTKEALADRITDTEKRIRENEVELRKLDDIPEKYRQIRDPQKHEEAIKNKIGTAEQRINRCNDECIDAIRNMGDRTAEDFTEELLQKEAAFKAAKTEYAHWKNIADVFFRMKEQIKGNPMEDIEAQFREYVNIITDGNIELLSIDEKMSADLSSGNNKLAYDILSNGTKDTISLAFRLAMLDHLYPEGGGLAVFDDAFTEMDPQRVHQSCKLIKEFAKKNQVIFITCDEKYMDLMDPDSIIKMSR